jgi:hypothetical protein
MTFARFAEQRRVAPGVECGEVKLGKMVWSLLDSGVVFISLHAESKFTVEQSL